MKVVRPCDVEKIIAKSCVAPIFSCITFKIKSSYVQLRTFIRLASQTTLLILILFLVAGLFFRRYYCATDTFVFSNSNRTPWQFRQMMKSQDRSHDKSYPLSKSLSCHFSDGKFHSFIYYSDQKVRWICL